MEIHYDLVNKKGLVSKARELSSSLLVRRDLAAKLRDTKSNSDVYMFAYEHGIFELKKFIDDNKLMTYDLNETPIAEAMVWFADDYYENPDLDSKESTEKYRARVYDEYAKGMLRFVGVVGALVYHRHRYQECPDDKEVEERNCNFCWLEIKKLNRDNKYITEYADDVLIMLLINWYTASVMPTIENWYEKVAAKMNPVPVKTYEGHRPKIPASEMAEGYDFDFGI